MKKGEEGGYSGTIMETHRYLLNILLFIMETMVNISRP